MMFDNEAWLLPVSDITPKLQDFPERGVKVSQLPFLPFLVVNEMAWGVVQKQ